LRNRNKKVLSPEYPNNQEWTFETASYIKEFFGHNSTEYSWISQFKWHVEYIDHPLIDNANEINSLLKEKPKKVVRFLDNCKSILKNKGLYKPEKKNWFSDRGNDFLIKSVIGLVIFGFGLGYWAREFELFSTLFNKKESIIISKPLKPLAFNIADKPTDNVKKNNSDNE
tara:strand:- start:1222 stop:1731 length:510 start_codon:yes stop_codon:yes gene_type:complete